MKLEERIDVYQRGTKPTVDGYKLTPKQARRVRKRVLRAREKLEQVRARG